eukprot:gene145-1682_t
MAGYLIPKGIEWVKNKSGTEYMTGYLIPKGSQLGGKAVNEVGLAGMRGIYLAHLDRADGTVVKVESPSTVLKEGDTLWFYSDLEGLSFLFSFQGMQNIEKKQIKKAGVNPLERRLVQYNAAIVGVHRRGERLKQKIGDITLLAGDLLLVDTGDKFLVLHDDDNTVFSLVSEVPESAPQKSSKMWIALAILIAMVTVQSGSKIWIALAILIAMVTVQVGHRVSGKLGNQVVQSFTSPNEPYIQLWPAALLTATAGILSCIYIVTALPSEILAKHILTNNAAAALMFPIATIAGDARGIPPKLMSYTLMLGASASFISPFGYQCNLMVFNAGAMKFKDLASLGVPIQLWMWLGATLIMGLDSVYIMLGVSMGLAITVSIGAVFQDHIRARMRSLKVLRALKISS